MLSRRDLLIASALPVLISGPARIAAQDALSSPLREMLAYVPVPDAMPEEVGPQLFSFSNMGAVMASIGHTRFPDPENIGGEDFIQATQKIPLDTPIYPYAKTDWRRLIGFGPQDVTAVLTAYSPPQRVRVYAGDLVPEIIRIALTGQDYVETEEGGFALFSGPNGDGFDLTSEIDAAALGAFNYVLLADSLVITTNKRAEMDLVLDAVENTVNLGQHLEEISELLPLLEQLSGSFLFDGSILASQDPATAEMPAEPTLPPARLFAGGVILEEDGYSGGFLVEFAEPVGEEVIETIETRMDEGISLISGTPLTELIGPVEVDLLPDTSIVEIRNDTFEMSIRWLRMIQALDLAFLGTE